MASIHHVRSKSFPLESPHPLISQVDLHLLKLKSSSSSPPISQKLTNLYSLFNSIHQMLLLPLSHRSLLHDIRIDELLESSLRLLDFSKTAMEALLQTKEFTHELKSVLRRKKVFEMGFVNELRKCSMMRKMMKMMVQKGLKEMGKISKNDNEKKQMEDFKVVGLMKEAEGVAVEAIKSLLFFISGGGGGLSKLPLLKMKRSFVSKITRSKRSVVFDDDDDDVEGKRGEVHMVDDILDLMMGNHKKIELLDLSMKIQNLQSFLGRFELEIQDIEEELERLYRLLIKTRVSLLNIFNN